MEISGEAIADAVNVANDLRAHFGIDLIDDLPESIPGHSKQCVLARAFNFDCSVGWFREPGAVINDEPAWGVFLPSRAHARILAKALRREVYDRGDPDLSYQGRWAVPLPTAIAEIAVAFDADDLPKYSISKLQKDVYDEIQASHSKGLTPSNLIEYLGRGVPSALRALERKGFIYSKPDGKTKRYFAN